MADQLCKPSQAVAPPEELLELDDELLELLEDELLLDDELELEPDDELEPPSLQSSHPSANVLFITFASTGLVSLHTGNLPYMV